MNTLVALSLALATFAPSVASAENADNTCIEEKVVAVRLGEYLFAIPLGYRPGIFDHNSNIVSLRYCRDEAQERIRLPVEASKFTISTSLIDVVKDKHTKSVLGAQIIVQHGSPHNPRIDRNLAAAQRRVAQAGLSVSELKVIEGFHAFAPFPDKPDVFVKYIATPGFLQTPDGHPVVFTCSPASITYPSGYLGHSCSTLYALSDRLSLHYRFRDGRAQIGRWRELDAAVRAFVRHLMVGEKAGK